MATNTGDMPEDVMVEILSRLTVKALMRFRCISKFMFDLIGFPAFIFKHLKNYSNDNRRLVVNFEDDVEYEPVSVLFLDETLVDTSHIDLDPQIPMLDHMVGPYDGIFCIYEKINDYVSLWNPATRECRPLPKSTIILPPNSRTCYCNMGFGLDLLNNDYKLILVRTLWDDAEHLFYTSSQGELYTLSTNDWKDFRADELSRYLILKKNCNSIYLNGACYWLALQEDDRHVIILSFNLSEELFQAFNGPLLSHSPIFGILGLYDESLSLMIFEELSSCMDIWVMKGIHWNKQVTVGPLQRVREPLGFWKNESFLMESITGELLLYDASVKELRSLGLESNGTYVYDYKESLLTV